MESQKILHYKQYVTYMASVIGYLVLFLNVLQQGINTSEGATSKILNTLVIETLVTASITTAMGTSE